MEENNRGVRPWQWAITIIVILILIALGAWMAVRGTSEEVTNENEISTEQTNGVNRLAITDQFPGNIVHISTVQLAQDGFVSIHKDENGVPGAVIGFEYFNEGSRPGSIELTESTIDGETYYAVLRMDDGDMEFDVTKDTVLKDPTGADVVIQFTSTTDLPEDKG